MKKKHNRSVLKRLIDLSLFLAKNGLPFRGHREKFSHEKPNQELYIELVKLVSKYDAVLAKHLAESNKNEIYLSHMIQADIITSMAHETVQLILNEIKLAKYFSIIVDSTIAGMGNWRPAGRMRPAYLFYLARATFSNYFI